MAQVLETGLSVSDGHPESTVTEALYVLSGFDWVVPNQIMVLTKDVKITYSDTAQHQIGADIL